MKWAAFIIKIVSIGAAAASAALASGISTKEVVIATVVAIVSNAVGQFQKQPHVPEATKAK